MRPPVLTDKPITRAALEWAEALHGEQLRFDCAPFILHPLEVAALLNGRGYDDEVVAAGLLHDVVEDTDASIDQLREAFGERVADIVAAVTEDATIDDYHERKAALRSAVAEAGRAAHAVFAADKVVKARELRAEASRVELALDDPVLGRRLEHYERSLEMLAGRRPRLAPRPAARLRSVGAAASTAPQPEAIPANPDGGALGPRRGSDVAAISRRARRRARARGAPHDDLEHVRRAAGR